MSNISSLSTGVKTLSPLWAYAFFLAGCKVTVKHKACLRRKGPENCIGKNMHNN